MYFICLRYSEPGSSRPRQAALCLWHVWLERIRRFLAELRRRSVYQVAIAYAVVGWVVIQTASVILPRLRLPEWMVTFVIVLVAFGFPIALVLA